MAWFASTEVRWPSTPETKWPKRPYRLVYSYTPDEPVVGAAVHSRHVHIDQAAVAFCKLKAPFKQVIVETLNGDLEYLDEWEEAELARIAAASGYEVEEIEG
jgi:hypothetical protein